MDNVGDALQAKLLTQLEDVVYHQLVLLVQYMIKQEEAVFLLHHQ